MRPPKILFVNPPSVPYHYVVLSIENKRKNRVNFLRQTVAMPTGILYLASVLERDFEGADIRILDYGKALREHADDKEQAFQDLDEFVDHFLYEQIPEDFVPDMIGFSILFSTAHRTSGFIADAMKRRWPDVTIVAGGMHATNAVPSLLEMPSIDYVCRGEAESIVSKLVTSVMQKEDCEEIKGVYGPKKIAAATSTHGSCMESADLIDDLDLIPFPAWHLIPMEEYVHSVSGFVRKLDEVENDREATIVTTRGCPFSCTFCSSWTVHGRKMRFRSIPNVVAELEILHKRYGVDMVIPEDDLFTVKKPRIVELCNTVADHFKGALHFQFPNGLSVACLDREVIDAMVRMGMTLANVAIESGSAYVQKHIIKKNCDLDRAKRVVQECRDAGTAVRAYFVLGFPGETKEQMQETFDLAASLASDWNVFSIAAPLNGTEMYEQMLERGSIDSDFNWDTAFYRERQFDTPEVTADELKAMVNSANLRINFFGNYNLKIGDYQRAIRNFQDVLSEFPGHLAAQYCIGLAHKHSGDHKTFTEDLEKCRKMLATDGMAQEHLRIHPELFPEFAGDLVLA